MFDVLIVEDDPMVAMINKQYVMQNKNFKVLGVCKDGNSAWEFLKNNKVDLVVLDQYMPNKSGIELLQNIRNEGLPVSVIMVTAANDSETVEDALRLGIIDYLVKPFSNSRFNQALNVFLQRKDALGEEDTLSQRKIDSLINGNISVVSNELPKGIQEVTLNVIRDYLKGVGSQELTSEIIADDIKVSRVTVRRYMSYLLEIGEITGRMNYETGGRPSMLYRWID